MTFADCLKPDNIGITIWFTLAFFLKNVTMIIEIQKIKEFMKKTGFTLAEVLITLVIIGVVAALTVPGFMNNSNNMEFRSALKKAVSVVNQALVLHYALTGLSAQDYTSAEDLVSGVFMKRMAVIDGENEFTSEVCDGPVFTVDDGMIFCVTNFSSDNSDGINSVCNMRNTTPCIQSEGPNLWMDVNGVKKPNRVTTGASRPKDIYQAQIYAQKVVPYGIPAQEILYGIEVRASANPDNSSGGGESQPDSGSDGDDLNLNDNNNDETQPSPELNDSGFPDTEPPPDLDEDASNLWEMLMALLKQLGNAVKNWVDNQWNDYINGRK